MAQWPDSAQLAQSQDVEPGESRDAWEWRLSRVMAAAIAVTKREVGLWVEGTDEPDEALAEAALRMADLMSDKTRATTELTADPTFRALIKGHRRRFGIG